MEFTPRFVQRVFASLLIPFALAGTTCGQTIVAMPQVEDVEFTSLLQGCCNDETECCCKSACQATETGQAKFDTEPPLFCNPIHKEILALREELSGDFSLATFELKALSSSTPIQDPGVQAADFLSALETASGQQSSINHEKFSFSGVQGAQVMTESQAATLRYAADSVEQVAATLDRVDIPRQGMVARSLAEAILLEPIAKPALPANNASLARPVSEAILR